MCNKTFKEVKEPANIYLADFFPPITLRALGRIISAEENSDKKQVF